MKLMETLYLRDHLSLPVSYAIIIKKDAWFSCPWIRDQPSGHCQKGPCQQSVLWLMRSCRFSPDVQAHGQTRHSPAAWHICCWALAVYWGHCWVCTAPEWADSTNKGTFYGMGFLFTLYRKFYDTTWLDKICYQLAYKNTHQWLPRKFHWFFFYSLALIFNPKSCNLVGKFLV